MTGSLGLMPHVCNNSARNRKFNSFVCEKSTSICVAHSSFRRGHLNSSAAIST